LKPGLLLHEDTAMTVAPAPTFVSRGGLKLDHALTTFAVDPTNQICADVGASTGGFTDCLLQHGAARVYAIDVGYGQLDWRLRNDPRVVVMERTNARYLESLPEPVDLVVVDASFISLKTLLPAIVRMARPGGRLIALIKPQFEAGREKVGKGGVVREVETHRDVLEDLTHWVIAEGLSFQGLTTSPLRGPAGNVEFLALVGLEPGPSIDVATAVENALVESTHAAQRHDG
jgi:23S rRNA (cytidine1920-2'-O)/16S rRNA (cytidine1409-2'-O)-methyltransferase